MNLYYNKQINEAIAEYQNNTQYDNFREAEYYYITYTIYKSNMQKQIHK